MTCMKGLEAYSFHDCLKPPLSLISKMFPFPFLHINHLIVNKKAVNSPKDQVDVVYLEKIKKLREEENL